MSSLIPNSKFQIPNSNNGFTIIETIIVIFVISMGLVGVLSLVVQNVQVEFINKNMLIASQLAQEGLELTRNVRDNNWLLEDNWKLGIDQDTNIVGDNDYSIYIDTSSNEIKILDADGITDSEAKLFLDSNNFYVHSALGSGTSTMFSRLITVDENTDDYITISCIVEWQIRANTHQYSAQTKLYNWRR